MQQVKTVTCEDQEYKIASIRAGQMRRITEERRSDPNQALITDNFKCVRDCLNNAKNPAASEWTLEQVEDLSWPTYRLLLTECQKISGFDLKTEGEAQATATTSTGNGSTVA